MQVKVDDVTQTGAGYFVHFRLLAARPRII